MNVVLQSPDRTLLSVSSDELVGICNALNEICNDACLGEAEFQTRLGVTREVLVRLLKQMPAAVTPKSGTPKRSDVWVAEGAVHMLCITAWGDPVELNTEEARQFAAQLNSVISAAE